MMKIGTLQLFVGNKDVRRFMSVGISDEKRDYLKSECDVTDEGLNVILKNALIYLDGDKMPRELEFSEFGNSDFCEWYLEEYDASLWVGNCGIQFAFSNDDDPNENGMNYCPRCGRKLRQKAIQSFSE